MRLCIQWLLSLPIVQQSVSFVTVTRHEAVPFTLQQFNHACAVPITSLLLDSECLLDQKNRLDTHALCRIKASTERLKELLQAAKGNKQQVFSVCEAIAECEKFFIKDKSIVVQNYFANGEQCLVKGSKILLSEVLMCLFTNAVEAYAVEEKHKTVYVDIHTQQKDIHILIRDYGRGMNIFEMWCAQMEGVSCHKKSSGLGLPFCIKTLQQYFHGRLWIESRKGVGTTVHVVVPYSEINE